MRSFPVGHPGDFPRGLATTAGVPIAAKLLPLPEPPVLDLTWAVASAKAKDCQSQYRVPTKVAR
jgi:hypothetical protein